jgi:hypothetical protein
MIDGREFAGWFTEDFTLAELRTLRAVERLPELRQESTLFNGRYLVPTPAGGPGLRRRPEQALQAPDRVAPETKHPTYFDSIGLSLEEPLLAALRRSGLNRPPGRHLRAVVRGGEPARPAPPRPAYAGGAAHQRRPPRPGPTTTSWRTTRRPMRR